MTFFILRWFLMFTVISVIYVEIIGYFWHRMAEHNGWFGETVRYRHYVHHEEDYPSDNLRPLGSVEYKDAGSWTWYVLAAVSVALMFLLLPLRDAIPMATGGVLYAYFVVSYFHASFHIEKNLINRFSWFKRLIKLHDIHHLVAGNYGIVFFWMDKLFGTFVPEFPKEPINHDIFPGLV